MNLRHPPTGSTSLSLTSPWAMVGRAQSQSDIIQALCLPLSGLAQGQYYFILRLVDRAALLCTRDRSHTLINLQTDKLFSNNIETDLFYTYNCHANTCR